MKFNVKFAIFVVLLILPVLSFGQGSGSSKDSKSNGGSMAKKSNFAINRSTSGTVTSINASTISIRTGSGKTNVLIIKRNTKFVGGRPRTGERAKVTYLASNKNAVLIRRG